MANESSIGQVAVLGMLFLLLAAGLLLVMGTLGDGGGILLIEPVHATTAPVLQVLQDSVPYAPQYGDVKLRNHAVEAHGNDAVRARKRIRLCDNIEAYYCPTGAYATPRYILICRNAAGWCAGMIVNNQGVELTAWCAPCSRWNEIVAVCAVTSLGDD